MKKCPQCKSIYADDSLKYCLQDRTPLISEPPTPQEQQADTLIISSQTAIPLTHECSDKWLHDIAENDKRDIQNLVVITACNYNDFYLKERFPYLLFTFSVLNASVYKISIEGSLKGMISLNHQRFSSNPSMEQAAIARLFHGGKTHFKIRQSLHPHEAGFVREPDNIWFSFKNLTINFTSDADEEIRPLKLPEEVSKTGDLVP